MVAGAEPIRESRIGRDKPIESVLQGFPVRLCDAETGRGSFGLEGQGCMSEGVEEEGISGSEVPNSAKNTTAMLTAEQVSTVRDGDAWCRGCWWKDPAR